MTKNIFEDYVSSWKPSIKDKNKSLYIAIADQLEEDIKKGIITPGTKLPSQRDLANYLGINLSTISRAFKLCVQKGIISATVGKGTFISSDVNANNYLLPKNNLEKIIELGTMVTDYESNDIVAEQLKKMTLEPDFSKVFNYGMIEGNFFQKKAAIKYIKRVGYKVLSENILFSAGGQNAIAAILGSLFDRGDKIGTNNFTFPGVKTAANMLGIELVPIKEKDGEVTEDGILYACKSKKIKGIYLIPDYLNPTTKTMSLEKRKLIGEISKKENLLIVEDAIFSQMNKNPLKPIAYYAPENTIYISSLSKIIVPGLRLAFIVVPLRYKSMLSKGLYNINISVSTLMVELASRIINSSALEEILASKRKEIKKRNEIVDKYLEKYCVSGGEYPIFRWIKLPDKFTGEEFEAKAYKSGVQVYSAERFVVGKVTTEKAMRITLTATENERQFEEGIKIIKFLLESKE